MMIIIYSENENIAKYKSKADNLKIKDVSMG